ncbi:hypothetical protein F4859DRAFT_506315 [Xylaria cf. heliscus]|nr:hypothetical protein F4859DRAFT_506315 [Xylaria cf. heliscus]
MSNPRPDSPDFQFCDDGGRPKVVTYIAVSVYSAGYNIFQSLTTAGDDNTPYLIATVPSVGTYTLCLTNGQPAMNGGEFAEDSCVRDVRKISEYLKSSLVTVHTQLFTAEDPPASSNVTTEAECLATYSNIQSGLQRILSVAEPGSYVYIHYSGHGVRMEATSEFSNRTTGDLALNVLEDASQSVTRPFPGLELAHILKSMVSKGLLVTLVLDCCFSGSVVRDSPNSSTRYRYYNRGLGIGDTEKSCEDEHRDLSMLPNWLVNPKGYTVITASGPHEVALELNFGDGTSGYRHGALSYFLLRAMKKLGGLGGKHAHIYPHLCSLFRQFRPTQNPMWYGNSELYFFGDATLSSELTGSPFAVFWDGDCLQLQGGQAHGIYEGDQFVVNLANNADDVPFQGLYRVSLIDEAGDRFLPGTPISVKDGSRLLLEVENTESIDLYIHIYNLGPLGQVKNIQRASYSVIPPRDVAEGYTGELVKTFLPVVSPELIQKGFESCEDILKVFISNKPTSFASLEMQSLDDFYDRGDVDPVEGYELSVEREDWVSCNFRIRTIKEPALIIDRNEIPS